MGRFFIGRREGGGGREITVAFDEKKKRKTLNSPTTK